MSRNSSGTYTLPAGNPVVAGTLIEASWANTTLSDIASALTDSLSRSGEGGMTAPLRLADGTVSLPGLAFSNETSTGLYRAGSGDMRLAVTGSQVVQFLSTGVSVTGTLAVSSTSTFTGAITASGGVVGALTGNASTATALQTSRTIWGRSFNGTGNVTGALTGVTDITTSGNASVGGTLAVTGASTFTGAATFNATTTTFENATAYYPQLINRNKTNDANGSYMVLEKIRSSAVVQSGDVLGNLIFRGYDGAAYLQGAYINALVSATPGTNDMPTDLVFGTTPDGSAGPSERFRFGSAGQFGIGGANYGTSGQVLTSNGSSAAPSWQSSTSQWTTSGSNIYYNTGNVGIGTSSPLRKFQVTVAGSPEIVLQDTTQTTDQKNWRLFTGNDFYIGTLNDAGSSGTDCIRIDRSANFKFNSGYGSVATAYGCRAWVNFNGTGTVAIRASGNVSSITDNGAGDYTANLTTAMPDTNFAALISAGNAAGTPNIDREEIIAYTTSTCRFIFTMSGVGSVDPTYTNFAVFR